MPEIVFSLLGAPRLERDGAPISVDTRKAIALLAYLAVTGQPHRRDALAALLWLEYDQSHARATLRRTLSALNKALDGEYLTAERETIGVDPAAGLRVDVAAFQHHLAACQTHGHAADDACAACVQSLTAAAALYHDDFMAGFSLRDSPGWDDWQFFQRETLRRELASALRQLIRISIAQGCYENAIPYARRWLALDPLHEPAHRYLMRLYAWSGQRAAALRQYHACVQRLDQQLGIVPLETTTRLYGAIKANRLPPPDPDRASAHQARAATAESANVPVRSSAVATMLAAAASAPAAEALAQPRAPMRLVGRHEEWQSMLAAYDAIRGSGHIVVLTGEAGIGKTRLAEEFAAAARRLGARVIATSCYSGEASLAYAPLIAALHSALADEQAAQQVMELPDRWLAEAARLAPELERLRSDGLPPSPPLDNPGAQSHFFEGLRQVLVAACQGARPGILLFDDVQWADSASLDMLTYIARRLHDAPLCLLLTCRDAEGPGQPRIRQLLAEGQRSGSATAVTLSRLSEAAVRELVHAGLRGAAAPARLVERLLAETEGVPFFVVEYLLALARGVVSADQEDWTVPGGIQDLLRSRLSALDGASTQMLAAAAVIGRWFDFETLRTVGGRSEDDTVDALEALLAAGLVRELSATTGRGGTAPAYDFSHEKLRALVYEEISLARRRLLHRRAAEALALALHRERDGGEVLGQIARHYLLAGEAAVAADYYQQAGQQAKSLYANTEALEHFRAALALGHPEVAALREAIADLHTILGEYAAALENYEMALALGDVQASARLQHKQGNVYVRRGEWKRAYACFGAALAQLNSSDAAAASRSRIYADLSLVEHRLGRLDQARQRAGEARELAERGRDERALAQAHNILGVLASSRGDMDEALGHLEQSLVLAESSDDPSARAAALNNLALALAARGDMERAIAHAEAALAACIAQGDRHHEAALHNNIADLLHRAGRPDAAMAHLKEAVTIYAEIGVEAGAVQPAIWKLTEW